MQGASELELIPKLDSTPFLYAEKQRKAPHRAGQRKLNSTVSRDYYKNRDN